MEEGGGGGGASQLTGPTLLTQSLTCSPTLYCVHNYRCSACGEVRNSNMGAPTVSDVHRAERFRTL